MATASQLSSSVPSNLEWKDTLEEILPPQGEWSEEEYLVLTDHRNRLVEFTDGFLDVLPMPTDEHQSLLQFLLTSVATTPRPMCRNTRSSIRRQKPSRSSACATTLMKRQA